MFEFHTDKTRYFNMQTENAEEFVLPFIEQKLKIDAIGKFFSYDLNNIPYAWNLPQWQAIVRGSYNLFDKFLPTTVVLAE
jgi:hypothetical protein